MTVDASNQARFQSELAQQSFNHQIEIDAWNTLAAKTTTSIGKQIALRSVLERRSTIRGMVQDCETMGGVVERKCQARPDFTKTDLSELPHSIGFDAVNFDHAQFNESIFENLNIKRSIFSNTNFSGASFSNVQAIDTSFENTLWFKFTFAGENFFTLSNFTNASFNNVDFTNVIMQFVDISGANFCANIAAVGVGMEKRVCASGLSQENTSSLWYLKSNPPKKTWAMQSLL